MSTPLRPTWRIGALAAIVLALVVPSLPASAASAAAAADAPIAIQRTAGLTQLSDGEGVEAAGAELYDSRTSSAGALKARETRLLDVLITAPAVAPADATAVILNVTAVSPTASGWLSVWPGEKSRPASSTLNFSPGTPTANLAVVPLGASRMLDVMNGSSGTVHVLVSFRGWVRDPGGVQLPGSVTPTAGTRVVDTRNAGPAVPARGYRDVQVTGVGAPVGASAALLNLVAVAPARAGYLIAHPSDTARPATTALTFQASRDRAGLSLMRLSASGTVRVWNMSSSPVHLVVDSFGWVAGGDPSATPAGTRALAPQRVLDTRATNSWIGAGRPTVTVPLPSDSVTQVAGRPSGVVLAITATASTSPGFLQLRVNGDTTMARTLTPSILNFGTGETVTNTTYVTVPALGQLQVSAKTAGRVDVIVDLVGDVQSRAAFEGRAVNESDGTALTPSGFTFNPQSGLFDAPTSADGRYHVTLNMLSASAVSQCVVATRGTVVDPAFAPGCHGGTVAPTRIVPLIGARYSMGDIAVPRAGALRGTASAPAGTAIPSGMIAIVERSDGRYRAYVPVSTSTGAWTTSRLAVGDYLVTLPSLNGLAGETADEIPRREIGIAEVPNLLAAGASTVAVTAGATTPSAPLSLLPVGTLRPDVIDPDGNYSDVTLTWRHQSGYVVRSGSFTAGSGPLVTRPGSYTLCATEGATTVCSGGASSWQTATPVVIASGGTVTSTVTLP